MKKIFLICTAVFTALAISGCGNNPVSQNNNATAPSVENNAPALTQNSPAVSDESNPLIPHEDTAKQPDTPNVSTAKKGDQNAADKNDFIGKDKAKEIALAKAGVTDKDVVIFDKTELERENGQWYYDVEFKTASHEYDAEIKADDGTVLEWDVDRD